MSGEREWWDTKSVSRGSQRAFLIAFVLAVAAAILAHYIGDNSWLGVVVGLLTGTALVLAYFVGAYDASRRRP